MLMIRKLFYYNKNFNKVNQEKSPLIENHNTFLKGWIINHMIEWCRCKNKLSLCFGSTNFFKNTINLFEKYACPKVHHLMHHLFHQLYCFGQDKELILVVYILIQVERMLCYFFRGRYLQPKEIKMIRCMNSSCS